VTELRADCSRCTGLCCVALPFDRGADFAFTKPGGTPCRHLADDRRCAIHDRLRPSGFAGCVSFDCFGAGQRVAATHPDWRAHPDTAPATFAAFARLRVLHELLWYLRQARSWPAAASLAGELDAATAAAERLAEVDGPGAEADGPEAEAHRAAVAPLLRRASELVRGDDGADLAGRDLAGRDLRRTDLRRTTLRGALLIGADLHDAVLDRTDLLGADLRGADLRGADASTALYLTQPQVNAARGDADTRLPAGLDRPPHWNP
jgi:hypothetical protein